MNEEHETMPGPAGRGADEVAPVGVTRHAVLGSPVGPLTLVATGPALSGVYYPEHRPAPDRSTFGARADAGTDEVLGRAAAQIQEYFEGRREAFDLPLAPRGTAWQQRVWTALREVPFGQTRSYRDVAVAVGAPTSVRAVGHANARNPLSIVVPCHRVVAASGAVAGYAGGPAVKQWLILHESGMIPARPAH